MAHALDAPIIRGDRPGPPPNFTDDDRVLHAWVASGLPPAPPARVDRELQGGDVLDVGGGAQVISTPGHTDGSIALCLPAPQVLFTGDTMAHFEGRVILGPFNLDRTQAMTSLRMLAELDVDVACFGHGEPIVGGASGPLRAAAAALSEP